MESFARNNLLAIIIPIICVSLIIFVVDHDYQIINTKWEQDIIEIFESRGGCDVFYTDFFAQNLYHDEKDLFFKSHPRLYDYFEDMEKECS